MTTDTANTDTANTDTANTDTANTDTANTDTANTDTANTDTANTANTANTNKTIVYAYNEYDKLSILEYFIGRNPVFETLVSNYIDYSIEKQENLTIETRNELYTSIKNTPLFNIIIEISHSIIHQTPYIFSIETNEETTKIINYLNKPFIDFIY